MIDDSPKFRCKLVPLPYGFAAANSTSVEEEINKVLEQHQYLEIVDFQVLVLPVDRSFVLLKYCM